MNRTLVLLCTAVSLALAAPTFAEGSFEMVNKSGYTITEVYAGPSNESSWGPNVLSGQILHNETLVVTLDTAGYGCVWDLKYVFSDGDVFEEFEVDICRIDGQEYTIE
ncbi:MAG: hypothetical protein ACNA7O_15710 [Rhodobacterales bacterium]